MVMKLEGLIPVIQCNVIEKTLEFYQQALRYIVVSKTETEAGLQWAYIKSDSTYLMLQKNNSLSEVPQSGNIILHYYTNDVAAQRQFMAARGFNVGEIEDTAYHIRQFFVEDPEGNRVAVGQDVKNNLS